MKTLTRNWRDHCRIGTRKHTETVSRYFDRHGRLYQSKESIYIKFLRKILAQTGTSDLICVFIINIIISEWNIHLNHIHVICNNKCLWVTKISTYTLKGMITSWENKNICLNVNNDYIIHFNLSWLQYHFSTMLLYYYKLHFSDCKIL